MLNYSNETASLKKAWSLDTVSNETARKYTGTAVLSRLRWQRAFFGFDNAIASPGATVCVTLKGE